MKDRGLAVLGAFVLIVVALFIRGRVVGGSDGGDPGSKRSTGRPTVACTPELQSVCDALAADRAITATDPLDLDDASEPDGAVDAWITWSPAPEIANFGADPSTPNTVWQKPTALGSATQAVLVDPGTLDDLTDVCRDHTSWSCLAAAAPDLSIGVGDPNTAEGIARLAPFAQALTVDDDPEQLDVDGVRGVVISPTTGQASAAELADRLTTQVGSLSMVAGPNDLLLEQTKTSQGRQRGLQLLTPSPAYRLVVVIAERTGRDGSADRLDCAGGAPDPLGPALAEVGVQPCEGTASAALAGLLFQVQKKVG